MPARLRRRSAPPTGHAELLDHPPGQRCGLLDVVLRSGGDVAEHQPLGGTTAHHHRQPVLELGLGEQIAILGRQLLGHPEGGNPARDD